MESAAPSKLIHRCPRSNSESGEGALWGITAYFNPMGYRRRLENFREFRRQLKIPLIAVELASDGRFELGPDDADILIQIRDGALLWQKERLLNIGLSELPPGAAKFAWLDADVVFADPDWHRQCLKSLDEHMLVQPFANLHDLSPDQTKPNAGAQPTRQSLIAALARGTAPLDAFDELGASKRWNYTPGHAWAARRELFDGLGLYDALIVGSGDKFMISAAYGRVEATAQAYGLPEALLRHLKSWAQLFQARVDGRIGYLSGSLWHLWHGQLEHRNYLHRAAVLAEHNYDPTTDLDSAKELAWRWSSDKPGLHRGVAEYLGSRREDG